MKLFSKCDDDSHPAQLSHRQTELCNYHKTGHYQLIVFPAIGIDGPAAFLGSEAPDMGTKIQILSVSQSQSQFQPHSQSKPQSPAAAEEPERDGDTETLLEPKTDIHELLQKQGVSLAHGRNKDRIKIHVLDEIHLLLKCFWKNTFP